MVATSPEDSTVFEKVSLLGTLRAESIDLSKVTNANLICVA